MPQFQYMSFLVVSFSWKAGVCPGPQTITKNPVLILRRSSSCYISHTICSDMLQERYGEAMVGVCESLLSSSFRLQLQTQRTFWSCGFVWHGVSWKKGHLWFSENILGSGVICSREQPCSRKPFYLHLFCTRRSLFWASWKILTSECTILDPAQAEAVRDTFKTNRLFWNRGSIKSNTTLLEARKALIRGRTFATKRIHASHPTNSHWDEFDSSMYTSYSDSTDTRNQPVSSEASCM